MQRCSYEFGVSHQLPTVDHASADQIGGNEWQLTYQTHSILDAAPNDCFGEAV